MSKELKDSIFNSVESNFEELKAIKKYLYDNPEVGGEEEKASRRSAAIQRRTEQAQRSD